MDPALPDLDLRALGALAGSARQHAPRPAAHPLLRRIDQAMAWTLFGFGLDGTRALLAMLAASMQSLLVFVLSALLIAVQIASAQLTPRVIAATFLRNRPIKFTIGLVVFSFMLSVGVLGRSEESVLQLSTAICILASIASIAMFLFLVDYALKALRPVSVVAGVAAEGGGSEPIQVSLRAQVDLMVTGTRYEALGEER
jgi:uncharacterized membrane protein